MSAPAMARTPPDDDLPAPTLDGGAGGALSKVEVVRSPNAPVVALPPVAEKVHVLGELHRWGAELLKPFGVAGVVHTEGVEPVHLLHERAADALCSLRAVEGALTFLGAGPGHGDQFAPPSRDAVAVEMVERLVD